MDFDGLGVVITGGGGELGSAIASAFHARGARIALLDLDPNAAAAVATSCGSKASRPVAIQCDVSERRSVERAFSEARRALGSARVLVNDAGVDASARFLEITDEEWERVMAVNAKGAFLCSQVCAPQMLAAGGGAIVNLSSQAAQVGQPLIAHYCASKAAVLGLTRALALELAPSVRVNAICPGVIDTGMVRRTLERHARITGLPADEQIDAILARTPLGRLQSASSVADAVVHLAAAEDTTGATLNVSGGMVMT